MNRFAAPRWAWMAAAALLVLLLVIVVFRLGNQASAGVALDDPVVWIEDGQRGEVLQVNGSTGEITARVRVGDRGDSIVAIPSTRDAVFLNRTSGDLGVIGAVTLGVDNAFLLEPAGGLMTGDQLELLGDLDTSTDAYIVDDDRIVVVEPGAGIRQPIPTPDGLGDRVVDRSGNLLAVTVDRERVGVTTPEGLITLLELPPPARPENHPPRLAKAGTDVFLIDTARRTVNAIGDAGVLGPTTCIAGPLTDVRVGGNHVTSPNSTLFVLVHDAASGILSVSEPSRSQCFEIVVDVPGQNFGDPVAVDGVAYLPNWDMGRIEVVDLVERTLVDSLPFASVPGRPFELEVFDNAVWANEPQGPLAALVTRQGIRQISKIQSVGVLVQDADGEGADDGAALVAGAEDGDGRAFGDTGDSAFGGTGGDQSISSEDVQTGGGDTPADQQIGEESGLTDPADTPPVGVIIEGIERIEPAVDELLANFLFSADTVNVGEEVRFTDDSTGNPVSWNWDFGDGTGAEGPEVVKVWGREGVFTVQLFIADANDRQAQQSIDITVVAVDVLRPPVANFRFRSDTIEVGELIAFESQSTGDPDSLVWTLGDGTQATGEGIEHRYSDPGAYEVTLTASNEAGSDSTSAIITVVEGVRPPEAIIAPFPAILETGQSVALVSESTNSPTSVFWDFGDGTSALGSEVRHSWSRPGTYRLRLTVSNSAGSDSTFVDVVIQPRVDPPIARFGESGLATIVGEELSFNDLSQNNPTSFTWEFGDGTSALGRNVSHSWREAGVFTVTLTVRNEAGVDEVSKTVTVSQPPPNPPQAAFTVSSAIVPVNSVLTFTDTSTNDPTEWLWDFGDGTMSTAQNPPHLFSVPGQYEITLTASNAGGSDSASQTILVSDPPVAGFNFTVDQLDVTFSDTSTNDPTEWLWDFGDGTTSTAQNPDKAFGAAGTYVVTLTAGNDAGTSAPFSAEVRVAQTPVAAFDFTATGLSVQFDDNSTRGPTSSSWDFGDGTTSGSVNPSHTYDAPGSYTVTLTVSNIAGTDSTSRTVDVDHAPPVADFTCEVVGSGVACDGSASAGAVSWNWDAPDAVVTIGQGSPTPAFTFGTSGVFDVTLTVANQSGATDSLTKQFTVDFPEPPVVSVSEGSNSNGTLTASATATNGPVTWDWSINNGGTVSGGQGTPNATFTVTQNGTYTITATATNDDGSDSDSIQMTVADINPPSVTVTPGTNSGGTIEASATATNGPVTWDWSINNGGTVSGGQGTPNATFTVTQNGTYTITATATNDDGEGSDSVTVSVTDLNPPVVTITSASNSGGTITASATTTNDPDTLTWSINNGGTVTSGQGTPTATFNAPTNGDYVITVTATNAQGSDTASRTVTVDDIPEPPVVTITSANNSGGTITASASATNPPITSWVWSIDNGGSISSGQGTASATFSAPTNGDYTITVTATNAQGSDTTNTTVTVDDIPEPPVVTITSANNSGGTITASASATNPPITSWVWSINNGGTITDGQGTASATFSAPTNGDYTITVTATNAQGSDTTNTTVTVDDIPEPPP